MFNLGRIKSIQCPLLFYDCHIMFLLILADFFSASYKAAMIIEKQILIENLGFAANISRNAALYYDLKD